VGEVTAAATYYLAEIYVDFSQALTNSERPEGLSPLELEQYELAIEEQAYPFEEKAIEIHESNLDLLSLGVYNAWIEKSLAILARMVPARYAKPEEPSELLTSLESFVYVIEKPAPQAAPEPVSVEAAPGESAAATTAALPAETALRPEEPAPAGLQANDSTAAAAEAGVE
jgi:hypothetical protein